MYRKLKRTWSHNEAHYIPKFHQVFPELKKISSEEMCDRWIELGFEFYEEKKTPVNPLMRLTLPFAIILMLLMIICIPFVFLVTGRWSYPLSEKNRIRNWFKSLRLL